MKDKMTISFEEDNLLLNMKETINFNVGGVKLKLDSKSGVLQLLDNSDRVLSEVDFPTEKIITNAYYDYNSQELVLEFENAQAVRVPIKTDFSNYYTIDETNAIINNIKLEFNNGLNLKANKQDVYNKQIVEEKLSLKEDKTNLGNLAYKDSLNKTDIGLGNVLNVESYSKQETYSKPEIDNINSKKVDKIQGKGLSTNDLTNELLSKLNSLSNYDDTNIQSQIDGIKQVLTSNDVDYDTLQELVDALKNNISSIGDIFSQLSKKVDKIDGKQLSTNDYTTSEKNKLANLNNYDDTEIKQDIVDLENNKANKNELFSKNYNDLTNKPTIPTKLSDLEQDITFVDEEKVMEIVEENSEEVETLKIATSENYNSSSEEEIPTTKAVDKIISNKDFAKKDELFSKNYNDLSNKPTIPSKVSDLTNDTGYITETYVDTAISNAITKVLNEEV